MKFKNPFVKVINIKGKPSTTTTTKKSTTTTTKPKVKQTTTTTTKKKPMGWNDVGDWIEGGIVPNSKNKLPAGPVLNPMKKVQTTTTKSVSTPNMIAMATKDKKKNGRGKFNKRTKFI